MSQHAIQIAYLGGIYVTLFIIEHYAPYFKNRASHTLHSFRNLSLALINTIVGAGFFVFALAHVYAWSKENEIGLLYQLNLSSITSLVVAFFLIDLWQYIWHRMNHVIPFLWRFHQVHHADKELDASSGFRFHTGEIILSDSFRLAVIPLLGIQLEQLVVYTAVLLPVVLFHHSNIRLPNYIDRWLRVIIVTPHMHRLHHSEVRSETDSNYGNVFSFWDRLFNSFSMRPIETEFQLGLGDRFTKNQWGTISGMLRIPFDWKRN